MDITLYEQGHDKSLYGFTDEVWIRYRGDELLDLDRVKAAMTEDQKLAMKRCPERPLGYYPALEAVDDDPNPFRFEEWWVFKDNGGAS